jgi:predicted patatin/cPLA2 family phospholipase
LRTSGSGGTVMASATIDRASACLPSVADLIRMRAAAGSTPRQRSDPYKLGLAIEGGGMRGVVAGGMVSAIELLGLRDVFDHVCGSSAGGCSAAYLVAGQARFGTSIFYEDINNTTFIDGWRWLWGRPVMSVDFLIDTVMKKRKALQWQNIPASGIDLKLVATDIDTGLPVLLDKFTEPDAIFEAMRASARIPLIAGAPVRLGGRRLTDGGLVEPIPLQVALDAGCTHVVVFLTRPPQALRGYPTLADRALIGPLMQLQLGSKARRLYMLRASEYKARIEALSKLTGNQPSPPAILPIRLPVGSVDIDRLEKDRAILVQGARQAMQAVAAALGGGHKQVALEPYFSQPDRAAR